MAWQIERREEHTALVTMTTNKANAQNPTFFADLHRAFDRLESEFRDCAVVLTGTGRVFSAGLDLITTFHSSLAAAIEVVSKLPAVIAASLHPQIFRCLPTSSLDNIEFNLGAINERAIASLLNFLDVNKNVPAAVVVLDETVAFFRIKPLHGPARHVRSP